MINIKNHEGKKCSAIWGRERMEKATNETTWTERKQETEVPPEDGLEKNE